MNIRAGGYSINQTMYGLSGESMQGGRRSVVPCPKCLKKGEHHTLFTTYSGGDMRQMWCDTCGFKKRRSIKKLKDKGLDYPVILRGG